MWVRLVGGALLASKYLSHTKSDGMSDSHAITENRGENQKMNEIRRMFIFLIVFHSTLAPVIRDTQTPDPGLTCQCSESPHVGIKLLRVEKWN